MTSFMGPMAPPPAAPPQPQAMDFQTDPTNRQRFRQFLNNRMQPPMMRQPSMMQAPMMQPPAHMPPILPEVDIFAPQGFEDGGSVPPRRTEIGGNDHMLSYITPDEADILMALGGSGEAGPMGIPSYNPNEDRANEEAAADDDMGDSDTMSGPSGNDDGPDPFAGEEGDNFSDPNQNYGNDDGSFNPSDFVDYGVSDDATQSVIDNIVNNLNNPQQQAPVNLSQRLAETQLDPMGTLAGTNVASPAPVSTSSLDFMPTDTGIAAVDNRSTRGPDSGRGVGLLGLDDLLSVPTPAGDVRNAQRNRVGTDDMSFVNDARFGGPSSLPTSKPSRGPSIGIMSPDDFLNTDDMNRVNISPLDQSGIGAAGLGVDVPTSTTTPAQDVFDMENEYLDEDIAAGFGPGGGGLDTFASRQQRAADYAKDMGYDLTDRSVNKRGAERGFGGITDQQRADLEKRAAESIFGDTFMNTPRNINNILEDNRATGIYTNPDGTVRGVTGLPDPDAFGGLMQSGVNFLGGFIPDFIGETYTGVGADPFDRGEDPGGSGGDGPDQRVKAPADPCPPGYSLVNGTCTPVSDSGSGDAVAPANPYIPSSVIVPSPRQPMPFLGQMPSGYGTPVTGGVNPQVMSEMQKYAQLLSRPQPQYPVGLANGGPVSSNLDMAADNFLKALMPAA